MTKCRECETNKSNIKNAIRILDDIIDALPYKRSYQEYDLDQSVIDIMFPDSNDVKDNKDPQ